MARVIFTPWKTQDQLLAVRDQFYPPPTYDGPDLREHACAQVSCWKIRGNLPHPVEATALLTDAILHDDPSKNSVFSIRATYSAAFCRYVTGLVDSKLHGQRKTMFQRAIDLGLPASFVELRHEATHRELPSLIVLRNATQRSLEWLWGYYWTNADPHAVSGPVNTAVYDGGVDAAGDDDEGSLKESLREILGPLLKNEDDGGSSSEPPKKKHKPLQSRYQTSIATQLASTCKASRKGAVILARLLLDEGVLVPAGRTPGESLNTTFIKWEQLLQMITEKHPTFLSALTEEMINDLAFTTSPTTNASKNTYCESLYLWLDHILRSTEWKPSRRLLSLTYLLVICKESPNHWTNMLKGILLKEESKRDKKSSAPERSTADSNTPLNTHTDAGDAQALRNLGWEPLDVWDSRPLGVV